MGADKGYSKDYFPGRFVGALGEWLAERQLMVDKMMQVEGGKWMVMLYHRATQRAEVGMGARLTDAMRKALFAWDGTGRIGKVPMPPEKRDAKRRKRQRGYYKNKMAKKKAAAKAGAKKTKEEVTP